MMNTLSIRLRPSVEVLLEQRCKRDGVSKSQLVNDLIEQALGAQQQGDGRRAAALLEELLKGIEGSGNPDIAKNVSAKVKRALRAKHSSR
jgi:hypothetical protein